MGYFRHDQNRMFSVLPAKSKRNFFSIESGPSLARVDAAVGEDARAQHALREATGVGLSEVAGASADDAHGRLGVVNRVCLSVHCLLYDDIYRDNRIHCDTLGIANRKTLSILPAALSSADFLRTAVYPILI